MRRGEIGKVSNSSEASIVLKTNEVSIQNKNESKSTQKENPTRFFLANLRFDRVWVRVLRLSRTVMAMGSSSILQIFSSVEARGIPIVIKKKLTLPPAALPPQESLPRGELYVVYYFGENFAIILASRMQRERAMNPNLNKLKKPTEARATRLRP